MTEENLAILETLAKMHPMAKCELEYENPFQLLVAVILSAQCTDARVNKVTPELFKRFDTPEKLAEADPEEVIKYIYSCGFYNNKAKNLIKMSRDLVERFNGKVPEDFDSLTSLAGVGRKTASVMYAVAFDKPAVPVDTHVYRVAHRLGISREKSVEKVESDIKNAFDESCWNELHHYLIFHGRYVCHSRSPECKKCLLGTYCRYFKETIQGD